MGLNLRGGLTAWNAQWVLTRVGLGGCGLAVGGLSRPHDSSGYFNLIM